MLRSTWFERLVGAITASVIVSGALAQVPPVGPGVCVPAPGYPCNLPTGPSSGPTDLNSTLGTVSTILGVLSVIQEIEKQSKPQTA
ncbi:MAG: hypothetical protein ACE5OQ_09065, partial [Woeseia sp.]